MTDRSDSKRLSNARIFPDGLPTPPPLPASRPTPRPSHAPPPAPRPCIPPPSREPPPLPSRPPATAPRSKTLRGFLVPFFVVYPAKQGEPK